MRRKIETGPYAPYVMIVVGNILMTFAYAKWMVPHTILNGGLTSIAMAIQAYVDLPIATLVNSMFVILLLLCLIFLGRRNFFRSLLSSVSFMIFFAFFDWLPIDCVMHIVPDLLLSGLLIAIGVYCCISANSSSVSVDVIALIIHKYYPSTNVAKLIRLLNFVVLGIGFFALGVRAVIVGLIFSVVFTFILNQLLTHAPRFVIRER